MKRCLLFAPVLLAIAATPAAGAQPAAPTRASARLQDCSCYDVSVVSVRGGRSRTLLRNQGVRGWNLFDLSPDRRRLVFSKDPKLYVAAINGRGKHALVDGYIYSARWSPDGSKIAFGMNVDSRSCSGEGLWVVNGNGSGLHKIADCTIDPAWSPDSHQLAFASYTGDANTGRVAVANADGTGFRTLSTPAREIFSITWSPRGDWVAYSLLRPHETIHVVRADGLEEDTVATGEFGSWSPDGKRIAYTHRDRGTKSPVNSIRIMNRDGKRGRVLISGLVSRPVWSPTGRWIAYFRSLRSPCECHTTLDALRADGSGSHRLTISPANSEFGPVYWARDGSRMFFTHAVQTGV
jgi:TolB protein